jgi:hypothetical protein
MSHIKVGDVCVGINHVFHLERNGQECTIVSCHDEIRSTCLGTGQIFYGPGYRVVWSDGARRIARDTNLRLKRPPTYPSTYEEQFTAGDWDLIPWRPSVREVAK